MEAKTAESSYLNPMEFLAKEEGKYVIPSGDDNSIYGPITQFEVSGGSSRAVKLKNLNEKLNKGWYFVYKCFLFTVICFNILASIFELIAIFVNPVYELSVHLAYLFLFIFEAYMLLIEVKAIQYKDRQRAEKAVRLITLYMFLAALANTVILPLKLAVLNVLEGEEQSTAGVIIGTTFLVVILMSLITYYTLLFGAKKVRDVLQEISLLQITQTNSV